MFQFLQKFFRIVKVYIKTFDIVANLCYLLLVLKWKIFFKVKLKRNYSVRFFIFSQKSEIYLLILSYAIYWINSIVVWHFDHFLNDWKVWIINEDCSACECCTVVIIYGINCLQSTEFVLYIHLAQSLLFFINTVSEHVSLSTAH